MHIMQGLEIIYYPKALVLTLTAEAYDESSLLTFHMKQMNTIFYAIVTF